jgi:hypothetical protein
MYFITNKTRGDIKIKDIKISLGPRQAMDLDRFVARDKADASKDLAKMISGGIISVKKRTTTGNIKTKKVKTETTVSVDVNVIKDELLKEMKSSFKEMSEELRGQVSSPSKGASAEDIKNIMKEVMAGLPQAPKEVVIREVGKKIMEDEEVEIDEVRLAEIHARAVNELTKDSKDASIEYKEENRKDDEMNSRVNELEDLLG